MPQNIAITYTEKKNTTSPCSKAREKKKHIELPMKRNAKKKLRQHDNTQAYNNEQRISNEPIRSSRVAKFIHFAIA